ncbi:serine-rich adhesin for platelets [Teleopsis dalmanni]|uniref:serine-rich adhesin for platelets n=1 Tax=Teleopsis dalmanni TaxID=139649 RepID=UPI0018CD075F|nr:serine-rich adhesin for platelets [Teleopsis dalmanni]
MSDQTPPKTPTPQETTSDRENGTSAGATATAAAPSTETEAEVEFSTNPTQTEFRQNHTRPNLAPPQPHELTAEWTVRAKLTFARAGENVRREFSSNDPTNPVRVIYKWSTLDGSHTNIDNEDDEETTTSTQQSQQQQMSKGSQKSTPLKPTSTSTSTSTTQRQPLNRQQHHESFRSTTSSNYADYGGADSAFSGSNASKSNQQASSNKQKQPRQQQSFTTSTNGVGSTSASTTATNPGYGTRCRSTCNIIVSAVADFLPADAIAAAVASNDNLMSTHATSAAEFIAEEEPDPFIFNTTASYTILPEKTFEDTFHSTSASRNFSQCNKILNLRDAFSQTSDTETKYFEEKSQRRKDFNRSPNNVPTAYGSLEQNLQNKQQQQQRKGYDYRRLTSEALLQPTFSGNVQAGEGSIFMPSLTPSPTQTFKSASLPRIPPLSEQAYNMQQIQQQQQQQHKSSSSEQQKKPRTVHIDVYCTGSEDEEQADAEASSSSSSEGGASKQYELESNSTPQTVLDTEQMLLRHQRITGGTLPRRITQQHQRHKQQQQKSDSQADLNIGHAITKSSTAEEVNESKQLLFRKHIGDQRAIKLQNLRQKYIRQSSDDVLSSSYPNSSHSTIRDATCSSISSTVPSTQADAGDSSWKETEEPGEISYSLAKSDSFDYDNSIDRLRIHQMERFWSRSVSEEHTAGSQMTSPTHYPSSKFLQPIYEVNSQRSSPFSTPFQRNDTLPSESENLSETDVFNTYPGRSGAIPHYQQHLQKHITSTEQPPIQTQTSLQQVSHFPRNRPGFLQFFGPHATSSQQDDDKVNISGEPTSAPIIPDTIEQQHLLYPNYQHNFARWKSETRDNLSNPSLTTSPLTVQSQRSSPQPLTAQKCYSPPLQRCGSEAPPTTTTASTFTFQSPAVARRFEMKRDSPAVSETSTIVSGYTPEYLEKAKKFGKVVSTVRKPGHHVGPTKNPSCTCESCQRWLSERFQIRGRAFSLGERPILKRPT